MLLKKHFLNQMWNADWPIIIPTSWIVAQSGSPSPIPADQVTTKKFANAKLNSARLNAVSLIELAVFPESL